MRKPNEPEKDYELQLIIKVNGYGNREHEKKTAQNIKKLLEVNLGKEVKVTKKTSAGGYIRIKRDDRNAYVSEER